MTTVEDLRNELELCQAKLNGVKALRITAVSGNLEPCGWHNGYGLYRRPYTILAWDTDNMFDCTELGVVRRKYQYSWKWEIKGEPYEYRSRKHAIGELVLRHVGFTKPRKSEWLRFG